MVIKLSARYDASAGHQIHVVIVIAIIIIIVIVIAIAIIIIVAIAIIARTLLASASRTSARTCAIQGAAC